MIAEEIITQKIKTRIGELEFTHDFANGYPTAASVEKLYNERDFQRACQAYLWSLPAVSFTSWQRGITQQLGAKNGQIVSILSWLRCVKDVSEKISSMINRKNRRITTNANIDRYKY